MTEVFLAPTRNLCIFDLDHTLLKVNCSYRFGAYLYKKTKFSLFTLIACLSYYIRHKYFTLSMGELHYKIFNRLFKGACSETICNHANAFLDNELSRLYNPLVQIRLLEAQQRGDDVAILSSSPDFLVRLIADRLRIKHWKATVYAVDDQGVFSHVSDIVDGHKKVECVRHLVNELDCDPEFTVAYSDSHLDIPLLAHAARAVGVNPDDKLKQVCLDMGWEILGK
ncbi:MAG: HAD-IB family phosphatase [Parachlamydia sp.]|jgi:HAD superfamily phosphoserine phosphatase-like hydrolase|nr:HAD-IB family phosphatase [Parachlamydia sp.]